MTIFTTLETALTFLFHKKISWLFYSDMCKYSQKKVFSRGIDENTYKHTLEFKIHYNFGNAGLNHSPQITNKCLVTYAWALLSCAV